LLLVAGCSAITGDFGSVVAIAYSGSLTPSVEEGDTLRLHAVALDAKGDTLPGVPVIWQVLAPDTVVVGITVDSSTGLVTGLFPGGGPWSVQGSAEGLRMTSPVRVTVTPAPDSVGPADSTRVTVAADADSSLALTVIVYDLTTDTTTAVPLVGKPVEFRLVDPSPDSAAAAGVALAAVGDTVQDPFLVQLVSQAGGRAAVIAHRVAGMAQPDSIVVDAYAFTARGDTVRGSPVRFVVLFPLN
jgi:hypothetical protein